LAEVDDPSPSAEAGVVVSLMVSLTVILSGIQPIGHGRWCPVDRSKIESGLATGVATVHRRAVRRGGSAGGFAGGWSSGLRRVERANEAANGGCCKP
jgi:hypothetical protein